MKSIVILSLLFGVTSNLYAQRCSEATLLSIPGKWKQVPTNEYSRYMIAQLPGELKVLENIHRIVLKNFSPKGGDASFKYTLINKMNEDVKNHSYQFQYTSGPMPYYCKGNSIQVEPPPYPFGVTIYANHPGMFLTRNVLQTVTLEENQRDHYGWLKRRPIFKDNAWFFGEDTEDTKWNPETTAGWLVTYDGKLPFDYVTRKEYLEKVKEKLAIKLEQSVASAKESKQIRPKAEQEKEKNEMVEMFVKGSARANKYLADYQTDEQQLENIIKKYKEDYKNAMAIVERCQKQPATELKKTAVITALDDDFPGFAEETDKYALIVIKDNPSYFNPALPKTIAQCFYITWNLGSQRPVVLQFYKEFMKTFDFAALKKLLGT